MAVTKTFLMLILMIACLDKRSKFDDYPWRRHTAGLNDRGFHRSTLCNNITDDKGSPSKNKTEVLVSSDSTWRPEFIQDLLPSAERTALLYHLSYLCLESNSELERLIRVRSLETQQLFGSSEALLVKCAGTSENLIKSLLPSLKVAIEKNKPQLALKFLEKAKEWIGDIIMDVKEMVKRYDKHNRDVAATVSDINKEKGETETTQQRQTSEMRGLQKIIDHLEAKLLNISKKIDDYEKKIELKKSEILEFIRNITGNKKENLYRDSYTGRHTTAFSIYSMIVPFAESIISYIFKVMGFSEEEVLLRALRADLSETIETQKNLTKEEQDIQNHLMDNQLKLAKLQIENDQMPSVKLLDEVKRSLSRIQKNLVQLQKFWEKVGSLMNTLKERTFIGEIWIEDLTDMKQEFLEAIDAAEEEWTKFGMSCMKANHILSIQANQAYRFLEISPSSLSKEEWMKEYERVKEKLEKK